MKMLRLLGSHALDALPVVLSFGVVSAAICGFLLLVEGAVEDQVRGELAAQCAEAALCLDAETGQVRPVVETEPADKSPLRSGTQFRVNCNQVDAGTVTDLLVPMDGGTAGARVRTDSIYVAPVSGTTQLRVGFGSGLTPSTGFELGLSGSSARDGVGVTLDLTEASLPTCVSEGNAQQVDVITGRQ